MRRLSRYVGAAFALFAAVVVLLQAPFAWRRFYTYPRTEAALEAIRQTRRPVARTDGRTDFPGVMHAHSHLSHDSMGGTDDIIAAAQRAGIRFIFMTDHYGWATDAHVIEQGLRGDHAGVFFVVGAEMRDGVMPFFLDHAPARYDPHQKLQEFVNDRIRDGAVVFLNHPDDRRRRWDLRGWTGMEIYRWVKQHQPGAERSVMLVHSGQSDTYTEQFLEESGALGVAAPFNVSDLIAITRLALDKAKAAPRA